MDKFLLGHLETDAKGCSLPLSRFFHLKSFRQERREGPRFFLSLLFLNNQLEISIAKAYFGVAKLGPCQ